MIISCRYFESVNSDIEAIGEKNQFWYTNKDELKKKSYLLYLKTKVTSNYLHGIDDALKYIITKLHINYTLSTLFLVWYMRLISNFYFITIYIYINDKPLCPSEGSARERPCPIFFPLLLQSNQYTSIYNKWMVQPENKKLYIFYVTCIVIIIETFCVGCLDLEPSCCKDFCYCPN